MIALQLRRGRAIKATGAGFAYGAPIYGRRANGRVLVPDERKQVALPGPASCTQAAPPCQIGAILEAEGHRPEQRGRWHPTAVARTLKRPVQPRPDRAPHPVNCVLVN
jgi:hypothetical protein